jgi:hypothetical protein
MWQTGATVRLRFSAELSVDVLVDCSLGEQEGLVMLSLPHRPFGRLAPVHTQRAAVGTTEVPVCNAGRGVGKESLWAVHADGGAAGGWEGVWLQSVEGKGRARRGGGRAAAAGGFLASTPAGRLLCVPTAHGAGCPPALRLEARLLRPPGDTGGMLGSWPHSNRRRRAGEAAEGCEASDVCTDQGVRCEVGKEVGGAPECAAGGPVLAAAQV